MSKNKIFRFLTSRSMGYKSRLFLSEYHFVIYIYFGLRERINREAFCTEFKKQSLLILSNFSWIKICKIARKNSKTCNKNQVIFVGCLENFGVDVKNRY